MCSYAAAPERLNLHMRLSLMTVFLVLVSDAQQANTCTYILLITVQGEHSFLTGP